MRHAHMGAFATGQCDQALAQATVGGHELKVARPPVMEHGGLDAGRRGQRARGYEDRGLWGFSAPGVAKARVLSAVCYS
ncbi:MAG: hypothetical protein O7B27_10915 [Gammaproteobacteria bacterium]|nr:hypothetical protein [Gammaproteobacteria bacterium]